MTKTVRSFRMEDEKEDNSWALANAEGATV